MIDILTWFGAQLLMLGLTIPIGYAIIHGILSLRLIGCKLFIRTIIYAVSGCIFCISLLSIVGFLSLTLGVLSLFIVFVMSVFYVWKKEIHRSKILKLADSIKNDLPTFCLMVFCFTIVGYVSVSWMWSPAGDPFTHEFLTSLILFHDRVPLNFLPFNSNPLIYGPGLHSISAFLSKMIGTFPGESVLMIGSYFTALLPLLVYVFAYYKTESLPLSLIAFSATFLVHPSADLQRWVFGHFFNGAFPPIGAMLCGLFLFFFTIYAKNRRAEV